MASLVTAPWLGLAWLDVPEGVLLVWMELQARNWAGVSCYARSEEQECVLLGVLSRRTKYCQQEPPQNTTRAQFVMGRRAGTGSVH